MSELWKNLRGSVGAELRRWLVAEQPGLPYASGALPLSVQEQARLAEQYRIPHLLPYERWDEQYQLFINQDMSAGFILELMPATGIDPGMLEILGGLFSQSLPARSQLQLVLYASPEIQHLLEGWRTRRSGSPFSELADRRVAYLERGNWKPLFSGSPFLLRDLRLFLTFSLPCASEPELPATLQALARQRTACRGIMESAGIATLMLDADGLLNLLNVILNPAPHHELLRWNPRELLREQAVQPDTVLFVGRESLGLSCAELHLAVASFSVQQYPENWAAWQMIDLIGDMLAENLRLPCPFLHTLNIQVPEQSTAHNQAQFKAARATQMADSPLGRFLPIWKDRQADWRFVEKMVHSGHQLLHVHSQLVLFAPQDEIGYSEQRLKALFQSRGWLLRKDRFIALHAFLSALPLMTDGTFRRESTMLARRRTMLSWSAVNTAPWSGEWKGTRSPLLLLTGRRGQIIRLDPFDNDQGNFNMAVAAMSGAGKSFFAQEFLISLLGSGGKAWVIDSGRSYEHLCRLVGGCYLDFDAQAHIVLNPFSGLEDTHSAWSMLKALLAQMAAPRHPLNELQLAHLEQAIKDAWHKHGNTATVSCVARELLNSGDLSAERVGRMLYPYTGEGIYGGYFEGEANVDLDHDLVVLELGGLDDKPDLQQAVLLLLMLRINHQMYLGDRERRKLCLIDEAWRLLSHNNASSFIEAGYRTARKFGGAYMTITQGIDDYYQSPGAQAALQNSDWTFLLRQKPESLRKVQREERLHLDDHMLQILSSLQTRQGQYSELAVLAPGGGLAIGRLIVDPFSEKLYSTRAQEYTALKRLLDQGRPLTEAIEELIQRQSR